MTRRRSVDVEAIHRRRDGARRRIAAELRPAWWAAYHDHGANRYELTPEAKGRRRLKNVALGYLMADDAPDAVAAASAQFTDADNMTDRIAALGVLVNSAAPERETALAQFHARYRGDASVIDKWFTTQALSTRPETLAEVLKLRDHADFSRTNPNRLRALFGAFGANQLRFHAADGAGYRLLADEVIAVGRLNPQLAARLVTPLGRWRRFDAARAALMRAELERIVGEAGVSKDVFEMASKSLASAA